jgi:hypothetical protein
MAAVAAVSVTAAAAGCGSSIPSTGRPSSAAPVWLCDPRHATGDPCVTTEAVTAVPPTGPRTPGPTPPAGDPSRFACFYVYPTSSQEPSDNSDLRVQPAEVTDARTQVSPFSSVCSTWAPMYRQVTLQGLPGAFRGSSASDVAYQSLLGDFRYWVSHLSQGLPIIFIGHSQGAAMLIRLLRDVVDPDPALRARFVSAVLLGGNVTVADGRTTGGSFEHLPTCTAPGQVSCVVAYSSFPSPPPPDAVFGRPGQGISRLAGSTARAGLEVACTDPATLAGAGEALDPLFPTSPPELLAGVTTPFVTYPGEYTATCARAGGATWLQVDTHRSPTDHRPTVRASLGPAWGYHVDDVSLALGDLVQIVADQERAWPAGATG